MLLSAAIFSVVLLNPQAKTIPWRPSYQAAKEESKRTGKPILIYFTTTWCGYCKIMEREAFVEPAVIKQAELYVAVKLDAEKEGRQLAKQYEVTSYPTFLVTTADAKLIGSAIGYKKGSEFTTRISQILNQNTTKARLARALKANPNDGKANSEMAIELIGNGDNTSALKHIEVARQAGYTGPELARALTEFGKQYATVDFAKTKTYLDEAIGLRAAESITDAYESLMLGALYAGNQAEALAIATRISQSEIVSPPLKERAASFIKSDEYNKLLQTPDQLLNQLVVQLQGQAGKRDLFYFKSLFEKDALITSVFRHEKHGIMRLDVTVDSWVEVAGTDRQSARLTEIGRKVDEKDKLAQAWLEFESELTLPNGEKSKHKGMFTITMLATGSGWRIATLIQQ